MDRSLNLLIYIQLRYMFKRFPFIIVVVVVISLKQNNDNNNTMIDYHFIKFQKSKL
jgi:hypothetical protein